MIKSIIHLLLALAFALSAFYLVNLTGVTINARDGLPSLSLPGYAGILPGLFFVFKAFKQVILSGHAWDMEKKRLEEDGLYAETPSGSPIIGPQPQR